MEYSDVTEHVRRLFLFLGLDVKRRTPRNDLLKVSEFLTPLACQTLIRVGSDHDGGYLLPNEIFTSAQALFSAGVDDDSNFELEFVIAGEGRIAYLADGSVDGPATRHQAFKFEKKFIGTDSNTDWLAFDEWAGTSTGASDERRILSMDIEGGEWDILIPRLRETWESFECIVMELHGLHRAFDPTFFKLKVVPMLEALSNFVVVHVHANNSGWIERSGRYSFPTLLEITFVREDLLPSLHSAATLPHPLDAPNIRTKRDLKFSGFHPHVRNQKDR